MSLPIRRVLLVLSTLACGVVASSCAVGVRQPATAISETSATLNGTVLSTTGGQGSFYIEYGTTPARAERTPTRMIDFTAGAIHQVSEPVNGLTAEGIYHYAVCAEDGENPGDPFCSREQRFVATDRDFVSAHGCWVCQFVEFDVEARSGPSGENPSGQGSLFLRSQLELFQGNITCLTVTANKATIGLSDAPFNQHARLYVQDNGSPAPFRDFVGWERLAAPPTSCPTPTDANFPHVQTPLGTGIIGIESGDIVVQDAPSTPDAGTRDVE
jgi:hypothetical protein